jgi:hypothetical protein
MAAPFSRIIGPAIPTAGREVGYAATEPRRHPRDATCEAKPDPCIAAGDYHKLTLQIPR